MIDVYGYTSREKNDELRRLIKERQRQFDTRFIPHIDELKVNVNLPICEDYVPGPCIHFQLIVSQ